MEPQIFAAKQNQVQWGARVFLILSLQLLQHTTKDLQKCLYQSANKMQFLLVRLKPNGLIWASLESESKGPSMVNDKNPSHK